MAGLPKFDDDNPIIQVQGVKSEAEGYRNLSETAGSFAKSLAQQAEGMAEAQSNALLLQTQAQGDTIKTNARVQMIQNPELASKIVETSTDEYGALIQQAVVNKGDRSKLAQQAKNDVNELRVKGAEVQNENNKYQIQASLFITWPDTLRGIDQSIGKPDFDNRLNAAMQGITDAIKSRAITPIQAENLYKSLSERMDSANRYHDLYNKEGVTAQEHNRAKVGVFHDQEGHHNLPSDQDTQFLHDHHMEDITTQGIKSDAASGRQSNPMAWSNLKSPQELNATYAYVKGTQSVNADNMSGTSFVELQNREKELDSKTQLNHYEQGQRDRIKNLKSDFNNGAYYGAMRNDPNYQKAEAEYNQRLGSLKRTPDLLGGDGKFNDKGLEQVRWATNNFVHQAAQAGEARHLNSDFINPISYKEYIQPAQQAFYQNGNPQELTNRLYYFDPSLREYFARKMANPVQRETTRIVGNLENADVSPKDIDNLIISNQQGIDYSALKLGEENNQEPMIKKNFLSLIPNVTNYINRQFRGSTERIDAMATLGANYIKMQALQNGDFQMRNLPTYQAKAAEMISKAYPIMSGSTWMKSEKDLPWLDKNQMDVISNYLINYVKSKGSKIIGTAKMSANTDINQLSVMVTPTQKLLVMSNSGEIIYPEQYSSGLLARANKNRAKGSSLYTVNEQKKAEEDNKNRTTPTLEGVGYGA